MVSITGSLKSTSFAKKDPTAVRSNLCNKKQRAIIKIATAMFIGYAFLLLGGIGYAFRKELDLDFVQKGLDPHVPSSSLSIPQQQMVALYGNDVLNTNPSDSRPKILIVYSTNDPEGALTITKKIGVEGNEFLIGVGKKFKEVNNNYDINFQEISSGIQMCEEISKISNLTTLIIVGHGTPHSIELSPPLWSNRFDYGQIKDQNPKNLLIDDSGKINIINGCFSSLSKHAEIILFSCSTGKDKDGIANKIAENSQRVVWAPSEDISSMQIALSDNVPTIPTFTKHPTQMGFITGFESTCKFFPDGSRSCGSVATKIIPYLYNLIFN